MANKQQKGITLLEAIKKRVEDLRKELKENQNALVECKVNAVISELLQWVKVIETATQDKTKN